ncbi:MAG: hypothetical protein DA328_05935 [Nitrososphaeraceae archaeon]|nr:hypothetical protein [Nitrososphaeraceae archaeon]
MDMCKIQPKSIVFVVLVSLMFLVIFEYGYNNVYAKSEEKAETKKQSSTNSSLDNNYNKIASDDPKIIKDINFNAAGDWACNEKSETVINNMRGTDPDLILGLGDYGLTPSEYLCWSELISPLYGKMKIAFGNHDFADSYILKNLENQFGLKAQSYSFNFNHIHFISMSTETDFEKDSNQYKFIELDLKQASADPNIKWIIVFMHKPIYNTAPFGKGESKDLKKTYEELFTKYGVDLVLNGHVQYYQRSYPVLYNEENPKVPLVINNGSTFYNTNDGTVFVNAGTGGDKLHEDLKYPPFLATQKPSYGFVNIELKNNGTTLAGKFISDKNEVIDRFIINSY